VLAFALDDQRVGLADGVLICVDVVCGGGRAVKGTGDRDQRDQREAGPD
jgi:hypothetical protein